LLLPTYFNAKKGYKTIKLCYLLDIASKDNLLTIIVYSTDRSIFKYIIEYIAEVFLCQINNLAKETKC